MAKIKRTTASSPAQPKPTSPQSHLDWNVKPKRTKRREYSWMYRYSLICGDQLHLPLNLRHT